MLLAHYAHYANNDPSLVKGSTNELIQEHLYRYCQTWVFGEGRSGASWGQLSCSIRLLLFTTTYDSSLGTLSRGTGQLLHPFITGVDECTREVSLLTTLKGPTQLLHPFVDSLPPLTSPEPFISAYPFNRLSLLIRLPPFTIPQLFISAYMFP